MYQVYAMICFYQCKLVIQEFQDTVIHNDLAVIYSTKFFLDSKAKLQ